MSLCQKLVTDEEIFPTKYGESASLWGAAALCWREAGSDSSGQLPANWDQLLTFYCVTFF